MFEAVVKGLITLCLVVLAAFLVIWVLGELGLALPAMVLNVFWIIVVLVAVLVLFRIVRPHIGNLW
jgi:hypothetical protein